MLLVCNTKLGSIIRYTIGFDHFNVVPPVKCGFGHISVHIHRATPSNGLRIWLFLVFCTDLGANIGVLDNSGEDNRHTVHISTYLEPFGGGLERCI